MENYHDKKWMNRQVQLIVGDKAFAEIVGDSCNVTKFQRLPGMVYVEKEMDLYLIKWQIHIDTATNKWRIRTDHHYDHLSEWSEWKEF